MADFLLKEDSSYLLLEDGSSKYLLESSTDATGEITPTDQLRIDTWEFDSPEPNVDDRDPINYYVAFQLMDNGAENIDKKLDAIRVTCKTSDNGKVQIYVFQQGDVIDKDNIESGTSPTYEIDIPDATEVTRHKRVKGGPKNMSIWLMRYSGTWTGIGDRDRSDEIILELGFHGTKK